MKLLGKCLMAGIALSFALPQLVLADPAIDETKSHDRGVNFTPLNAGSAQAPVAVPAVKKVEINSAIKAVTQPVKKQPSHIVKIKVKNNKTSVAKVAPAKTLASHPLNQSSKVSSPNTATLPAGNSSAMLVKLHQSDGSVISASLDRSGNSPKYKVGEKLVVNVNAHQDCNVVVFNYDATGTLTQIFPNDYQQNGFVKAGDSVQIGGDESPFDYQVAGKGGVEKVFVYAYPTGNDKAPLTVALNPLAGTPFRSTEMTVDQYRDMVNSSKVFFSREVKVMPKRGAQTVSSQAPASSPNKIEMTFVVEK
ncbi:MAG: DUF4384 domain-containing protein [Candidatus Obscuribacterales bacterium]|nr:DUF4384 domain-containing protein [Candidatus Obscuribacterales bacterium]